MKSIILNYCNRAISYLKRGNYAILCNLIKSLLRDNISCFLNLPKSYIAQNKSLNELSSNMDNLIIYLVPYSNLVNGGVLSLYNLYDTTKRLLSKSDYLVLLSTVPGIRTYCNNPHFNNSCFVFRFSQILKKYSHIMNLTIHIPEYFVPYFNSSLSKNEIKILRAIPNLRLNIVNQNSLLCPEPDICLSLKSFTNNITMTTAFARDTTQDKANEYMMPVHRFGVVERISQYIYKDYSEKKNIIVLSPDLCPFMGIDGPSMVNRIRRILSEELPEFHQVIVSNMEYSEYLSLISDAKYAITFGEGYDGYFVESLLSGSISFSVYNNIFFPDDCWEKYMNVFSNYNDMAENIVDLIKYFEFNPSEYKLLNASLCSDLEKRRITQEIFERNILRYYQSKYDYLP